MMPGVEEVTRDRHAKCLQINKSKRHFATNKHENAGAWCCEMAMKKLACTILYIIWESVNNI